MGLSQTVNSYLILPSLLDAVATESNLASNHRNKIHFVASEYEITQEIFKYSLNTSNMVREATIGDISEMHRVRMAVRENTLSNPLLISPSDYQDYLTVKGKGWVFERNSQLLGFGIVDLQNQNVWALFVEPEAENGGIGKMLHQTMLHWYFSQTNQKIWLSTTPHTRAHQFYKYLGWTEVGAYGNDEIKLELEAATWARQLE